jgi:hypothetical protein
MGDVRFARAPQCQNGSGRVFLAVTIESLLSGSEAPVEGCIPNGFGLFAHNGPMSQIGVV